MSCERRCLSVRVGLFCFCVHAHERARVRFVVHVASITTEDLEPTPPTLGAVGSDVLLAHWHTMSDTGAPAYPAFLAEWWRQPLLCRAEAWECMAVVPLTRAQHCNEEGKNARQEKEGEAIVLRCCHNYTR